MTDLSARGRRALAVGEEWEKEFIRDWHYATGIELKRRTGAGVGDLEPHPGAPILLSCSKRKEMSLFKALDDVRLAAVELGLTEHIVAAVCQKRIGSRAGRPNPRGVVLYWEDWMELLSKLGDEAPSTVTVPVTAKTYPNLWDGLDVARCYERPGVHPVVHGSLTIDPADHQLLPPGITGWAFVGYEGFLVTAGLLIEHAVWG